jgi:hypothetical protein
MAFYIWLQAHKGRMRQAPYLTHHGNGPDVVFLEMLFPHPTDSGVRNFFLTIAASFPIGSIDQLDSGGEGRYDLSTGCVVWNAKQ